jgi:hypothetical protein
MGPTSGGSENTMSATKAKGKGNGFEDLETARRFLDEMNFLD